MSLLQEAPVERSYRNKPILVFLDEKQVGNYTPTLYQSLATTYGNHTKTDKDLLLYFEDISQAAPAYLSSVMTGSVSGARNGKVYASYQDAQADAAACAAKGYKCIFYDYEKNQTDCCELPTGLTGCTVACHVSGACPGNVATGSSSTSNAAFYAAANGAGLDMGVTPAGMGATDIQNLSTNAKYYVLQAQNLINGNQAALLAAWNGSIGTTSILAGNPNTKIIVQMQTTTSTLAQMEIAWDTLRKANHPPDGLVIFYFTNSADVAGDIAQMDAMYSYVENHS